MITTSLSPLFKAVVLVAVGFAAACSAGARESGGTGTSGQVAFLAIEPSSMFMTLESRATQPLLDVRIAIRPIGRATEYTKLVSRLESGEKRTLSLGEFSGRDGTPFSLRVVRPKDIAVTAVTLTNEKMTMTVPWR
jgi:hypothetical protein